MPLIHKLERKFGRYAIPNLIQTWAGFLFLTFILQVVTENIAFLLHLDMNEVLKGQVWRLFSFVLLPPPVDFFWIIIYVFFAMFIGNLLEHAWGSFRVNAYFFWAAFCAGVFLVANYYLSPSVQKSTLLALRDNMVCCELIISSLIIAACCEFPEQEIRLMLVIPIKMKWLGLLDGARVFLLAIDFPGAVILVMSGFLIIYVPRYIAHLRMRAESAERRRRYEASSLPADEALHLCATCGKTEHDDPDLDFRISGGEEYCLPCLKERKKGLAAARANDDGDPKDGGGGK